MPHTALLDCLLNEQAALDAFVTLLEEEGEALASRAAPGVLAALTDRKNRAADEFAALGAARDEALAALGLAPGHPGTDEAAVRYPELAPIWQALLDTTVRARQLNERNGLLISTHLQFSQQALAALRAATTSPLYGADGRQRARVGALAGSSAA